MSYSMWSYSNTRKLNAGEATPITYYTFGTLVNFPDTKQSSNNAQQNASNFCMLHSAHIDREKFKIAILIASKCDSNKPNPVEKAIKDSLH